MRAIGFFPFTLSLLALVLLAGFWRFVNDVSALREPAITPTLQTTDAIVVLTGGSERLATGIALLEAGRGKKLFISGVHKGLTVDGVIGAQPVAAPMRACCIALGYQAGSTIGNAAETRSWMTAEHYHSLRLVTANYHMPRSLLLFRAAMPDVLIIPNPVAPDSVRLENIWLHPGTVDLLALEYIKFLFANLRIGMER